MYQFYSLILTLAAILSSPYWLIRGLQQRKYFSNVRQRFGWKLPDKTLPKKPLWLHAVSVGEVLAARALFAAIRAARPDLPVIVSTVTLTGQALARKEMPDAAAIFYFPFDWSFCVRRFLNRLQPRAVVLLETELWPNFLRECSKNSTPVLLANGRISDSSLGRYRCIHRLTRSMMENVKAIGVQSHEDKRRFLALGASEEQVLVTGNLKFDLPLPNVDEKNELLQMIRGALALDAESTVIVIGSTMKGEEPLFLDAFSKVRAELPGSHLILAPRHPERFDETADAIEKSGLAFQRRSRIATGACTGAGVLLLDTIGELRAVYSLASVAVIGGSFLAFGGHNPLEPAALGKAVVFGPEMSNFKEIAHLLLHEQAARQCSLEDLPATLAELLRNAPGRQILGQRAAAAFRQNQGATGRTLQLLLPEI